MKPKKCLHTFNDFNGILIFNFNILLNSYDVNKFKYILTKNTFS